MSAVFGKAAHWVTVHGAEIKHDVALFAGAVIATGVLDRGAPLTRDAIVAAVIAAGRRLIVQYAVKG